MALPRTFPCPVCGKAIPVKAKACHHCGACEKTGWSEDSTAADGLDLPEEDFNYDKFVEEEFGKPRRPKGRKLMWTVTAAVLLAITTVLIFFNALFR